MQKPMLSEFITITVPRAATITATATAIVKECLDLILAAAIIANITATATTACVSKVISCARK